MLKSVEALLKGERYSMGNHSRHDDSDGTEHYIYHSTCICKANRYERTFSVDNGGWNTMSTNRAINDYRRYFKNLGYTEIKRGDN